ncbi:MAG: glycosyltransferase family 2 protein [Nitrospirae bacterium]|nr:glycosyltransferase family 2 protein [Nitrospirota bacterium]
MEPFISIIIPNHNGGKTIGMCLSSIMTERPHDLEVIVIDDCSSDSSVNTIREFLVLLPLKLIELKEHSGASKARNQGAKQASGEMLFFMDSDCLLMKDTLYNAIKAYKDNPNAIIGGTYTLLPFDKDFFSTFQSIFVNYSETNSDDYIATHAMIINRRLFLENRGFKEDFLPILEDVEFSHRIKRQGVRLFINPDIVVRHIFNFNLMRSLKNAVRKSMHWVVYSLGNKDIFKTSGTASMELKINVICLFLCLLFLILFFSFKSPFFLALIASISGFNLFINRHFLRAIVRAKGLFFSGGALFYYMTLYGMAVGVGSFAGLLKYLYGKR